MLIADGELRAYLDGEIADERRKTIEQALEHEPALDRRLEALRVASAWTADALGALDTGRQEVDANAALAAAPLGRRRAKRRVPAWAAIAASLLLCAGLMTWQPARAMAQHLLGLLRFESVAVLEIDHSFKGSQPSESQMETFAQAVSDSVQVLEEAGPVRTAASSEEAAEWANLDLRLPAGRIEQPQLRVTDSSSMQMEIDLERVALMIDAIGGGNVEVPQHFDGAVVRVDIYEAVTASYGGCWGETPTQEVGCFQLVQTRSPSIVTTPELDLGECAQLALEVAGMSPEDAAGVTGSVDWASTLVIPIPKGAVRHEEVEVDGVTGVLVIKENTGEGPMDYAILWVKRGVAYGLKGYGDWGLGLQAANSLE